MMNCNYCKYVSITEEEQKNKYVDHVCMKHGKRLFHMSSNRDLFHDHITPCGSCCGEDFKQR